MMRSGRDRGVAPAYGRAPVNNFRVIFVFIGQVEVPERETLGVRCRDCKIGNHFLRNKRQRVFY